MKESRWAPGAARIFGGSDEETDAVRGGQESGAEGKSGEMREGELGRPFFSFVLFNAFFLSSSDWTTEIKK